MLSQKITTRNISITRATHHNNLFTLQFQSRRSLVFLPHQTLCQCCKKVQEREYKTCFLREIAFTLQCLYAALGANAVNLVVATQI